MMCEEKVETKIVYNKNPFIPKGRLDKKYYFIYIVLLNILARIVDYDLSKCESCSAIIICFTVIILNLFVVRNRLFDITLSNKKAWIIGVLFCVLAITLPMINLYLGYVLLPFGIAILCIKSKGINNEG